MPSLIFSSCQKFLAPVFGARARMVGFLMLALSSGVGAQSWRLAWSDEFNGAAGSAINPQNWQFDTGILNDNNEA